MEARQVGKTFGYGQIAILQCSSGAVTPLKMVPFTSEHFGKIRWKLIQDGAYIINSNQDSDLVFEILYDDCRQKAYVQFIKKNGINGIRSSKNKLVFVY